MAHCVISAKYPPQIDVTRTPLAYGDRAIPRLNRELNASQLLTRQRAVMSLCDHLHDPEHIVTALQAGIVASLKKLLSDSDITVRQKSTECLYVISGHAVGRDIFLSEGVILPLAALFDDKEDIARKNAHLAIELLSETPPGAEGIVQSDLVPILVKKLPTELDEIKSLILDTLHFCMFVNTRDALESEGMEVFTDLLRHEDATIRFKAARDIMQLSVPLVGKDKAVEVKCVPLLVDLLADEMSDVRANAAGALMMIAITTKGKYTALESDAIGALVGLVEDDNTEVQINALKALGCLSEAPEGREALQPFLSKIKERTQDSRAAVVKAAESTASIIAWKP